MIVELKKAIRYFISSDKGETMVSAWQNDSLGKGIKIRICERTTITFHKRTHRVVKFERIPEDGKFLYFLENETKGGWELVNII